MYLERHMRNWRQVLLSVMLLLVSAGCSARKTLSREDVRSEIRIAVSFTAESELFVNFIRSGHSTRHYAEGHAAYLDDAVKQSLNELERAVPEPKIQYAVGECITQLKRLERELSGIRPALKSEGALSGIRDRMSEIRKSLERAQSDL